MFYLILLLLVFLVIIISSAFRMVNKRPKVEDKGEIIYQWQTANGMWLSTKLFIIGISSFFVLPKYMTITFANTSIGKVNLNSIMQVINSLKVEFTMPSEWSAGDIMFLIIYIVIIMVIVNIPLKYTFTTNGIYYEVFLIGMIAFYAWEEIVCYDLERKGSNYQLKLWFRPPCFSPDWYVPIVTKNEAIKIRDLMPHYSTHYNEAKNAKKSYK